MPNTDHAISDPPHDCDLCPRLASFRSELRDAHPDYFNAPVPSFGTSDAELLIVGLAPGLQGANRTGRPFTGDYAGDLLYATLDEFGLTSGVYNARPDDGLALKSCMITNAVRCVPPQNRPIGSECQNCRKFLAARITSLPKLRAILSLGKIAHDNTISALNLPRKDHPFGHDASYRTAEGLRLYASYHCSRYNTNTGRLTTEMFRNVFARIKADLAERS